MDKVVAEKMLQELSKDKKIGGKPYSLGHVNNVAILASKVADMCGLDSEKAYILGLIHDIGRFFVVDEKDELILNDKHRHPIEGYLYLQKLGYGDEARICITHAFPERKNIYAHMYNDDEKEVIRQVLLKEYNIYDLLIQLADEMSVMNGWCSLESRFAREALEKGCKNEEWSKFLHLHNVKKMFDKLAGKDIYCLILDNILFA